MLKYKKIFCNRLLGLRGLEHVVLECVKVSCLWLHICNVVEGVIVMVQT